MAPEDCEWGDDYDGYGDWIAQSSSKPSIPLISANLQVRDDDFLHTKFPITTLNPNFDLLVTNT